MTRLWIGFALVIAYGSIYPFNFQWKPLDAAEWQAILASCCRPLIPGDVLGNVLLFVPFGYLGVAAARPGTSLSGRLFLVAFLGTLFALALQVAQIYLPSRNESLQDVGWNALGVILGGLLGAVTQRHLEGSLGRLPRGSLIPLLLVAAWLAYRLIPFVPSIDLASIKESVKPLLLSPALDSVNLFHDTVAWLVVAYLLQRVTLRRSLDAFLPAVVSVTFLAEVLIVFNSLHLSGVVGALLALVAWQGGLRRARWRLETIVFLLIIMLTTSGLEPFIFSSQADSFRWLPLRGLLGGSMYVNALAISEKVFLYGSLIYLLWQTGLGRVVSTVVASGLLLGIELGQMFVPGHVPEITDPLLVILAAATLSALERRERAWPPALKGRQGSHRSRSEASGGDGSPNTFDALPVAVNLRSGTVVILESVARKIGCSFSATCGLIIDRALGMQGSESPAEGAPSVVSLEESVRSLRNEPGGLVMGKQRRDSIWQKRTVDLTRAQFPKVRSRAEAEELSLSRTIRHILADFVEEHYGPLPKQLSAQLLSSPSRPPHKKSAAATRLAGASSTRRGHAARVKRRWQFAAIFGVVIATSVVLAFGAPLFERAPRILEAVPWAGKPAQIILDHHTHTRFSDGVLSVEELVALAKQEGCDALAITDHSDTGGTASDKQFDELTRLRRANPDMLLLGGVEINMPSYRHREHVNVIIDPTTERRSLRSLKAAAEEGVDRVAAGDDGNAEDEKFLRLAATLRENGTDFLLVYNHPSRKDQAPNENYEDMLRWNAIGEEPLFIGFAGAPGHQRAAEPGDYQKPILTMDRWDPVVAEAGGTWDRLLSGGNQVWGALAGSDYHNSRLDEAPCAFARTHLATENFSYAAILKALRAGTFWADHGRILSELEFMARVDGLAAAVFPGSVVSLGSGKPLVIAHVGFQRGADSAGLPLKVEFIGNCRTGDPEILASEEVSPSLSDVALSIVPLSTGADGRSCFLRARVRLEIPGEPDLMAYTNPIRFILQ